MKLPPGWDLPVAFASRLGQGAGRQRAMVHEGQLLLVLHKLPTPGTAAREGVVFWRMATGEWRASTGVVGLNALRSHIEGYARAVAEMEAQFERATNSTDYFVILEGIAPLARAASNLDNAMQSAREGVPEAHEIITLRDESSDVVRAAELLQIDAKNALDYLIARQNEEQSRLASQSARAGDRLNLITAIFLPLTAISGVFGMNLPSGLENATPALFWLIFFLSGFFGVVLGFAVGRKK
jgi:Mg2+ and Co2+ transporter CorA